MSMLRDVDEVSKDDTVHLYPQTRHASRACHAQLAVRVLVEPKKHWPMLVVGWRDPSGTDLWELVHRDNIRKKPASAVSTAQEKRDGDQVGGGGMGKWTKRGIMPGKKTNEIEGQDTLW
jgi:predicted lipoprotein with Yx(FWY)xxD motif